AGAIGGWPGGVAHVTPGFAGKSPLAREPPASSTVAAPRRTRSACGPHAIGPVLPAGISARHRTPEPSAPTPKSFPCATKVISPPAAASPNPHGPEGRVATRAVAAVVDGALEAGAVVGDAEDVEAAGADVVLDGAAVLGVAAWSPALPHAARRTAVTTASRPRTIGAS